MSLGREQEGPCAIQEGRRDRQAGPDREHPFGRSETKWTVLLTRVSKCH